MNQKEAVLQYIKDNGSITPKQAIEDLGNVDDEDLPF